MPKIFKRLILSLALAIVIPLSAGIALLLCALVLPFLALLPIVVLFKPSIVSVTVNGHKTNAQEFFGL